MFKKLEGTEKVLKHMRFAMYGASTGGDGPALGVTKPIDNKKYIFGAVPTDQGVWVGEVSYIEEHQVELPGLWQFRTDSPQAGNMEVANNLCNFIEYKEHRDKRTILWEGTLPPGRGSLDEKTRRMMKYLTERFKESQASLSK